MDLLQILPMLNNLGPWGIVIGIGITLGIQWLRNRNLIPTPSPAPTPGPSPGPSPAPGPAPSRPLLDLLQQILPLLLSRKVAPQSFQALPDDAVVAEYLKLVAEAAKPSPEK